jgi:hypothetical protein
MHDPTHPLDPDDHDREDDYEDAELEGIEPIYQSPGLTVRPLTAEQARRLVEVVGWEADTIARTLGVQVDPLVVIHGAEVAYGGLIAGGVAIVPAARLRAALGVDPVLSATEVGVLAAMAQTRLRAAA